MHEPSGELDTSQTPIRGGIVVAATPLGNLGDATDRLRMGLAQADVIAAEDTRRLRQLANALGVELRAKVVSNFDHNEAERTEGLIAQAKAGRMVLVVSDAGMPVVSDPGLAIVQAAHDADVPVTCHPGPSAVTTALVLSGLNVGHFAFDGFAPRKQGARRAWLETLRTERRAVCFFESPHRLDKTLADAVAVLGPDRRAAVCRELTKLHEEVRRGTLAELAAWAVDGARGEITVVIEGASAADAAPDLAELVSQVQELVGQGMRMKAACRQVAAGFAGVSVNELYDATIAEKS
nr:16S rRNA (cytidine(1402)-2'-O)-methyltransferase [Corynebacterium ulceribovis]